VDPATRIPAARAGFAQGKQEAPSIASRLSGAAPVSASGGAGIPGHESFMHSTDTAF